MADCRDVLRETQVVVLMGGLGTRLGLKDLPKAMADVHGLPFFEYQFRLLRRWGFEKFLFLVGYRAEKIEAHFGDGSRWGVSIFYAHDGERPMGTGGALMNALDKLDKSFLLLYGDSFMDIDYQETVYRYKIAETIGQSGLMVIMKNNDRYDKSNVRYGNGKLFYDKESPTADMQYIDYGVSVLSREVFSAFPQNEPLDLADVLHQLSQQGKLAGQIAVNRFYEIGSPAALDEFRQYALQRFFQKRRAVFLDRDGVINEPFYNDDIEQMDSPFRKEDFIYKDGILEVLCELERRGYLLFIVTNQPAAAKGKTTLDSLYALNDWVVQDLRDKGIEIRFVALCPHYPKATERAKLPFLIGNCDCRKPGSGLIKELLSVYDVDVGDSYMVGDSYTDILAGKAAGLHCILIGQMKCDVCDRLRDHVPDYIAESVKDILKGIETND